MTPGPFALPFPGHPPHRPHPPEGGVPVGSVVAYAGQITPQSTAANTAWSASPCGPQGSGGDANTSACPVATIEALGWLACDGRTLEVAKYPELAGVLGNLYGGDATTFNLPDYRGLFLRGVDSGSGMDPDVAERSAPAGGQGSAQGVGSVQCDALETHTHAYQVISPAAVNDSGSGAGTLVQTAETAAPTAPPARVSAYETRPKNVSVNYLIKYRS